MIGKNRILSISSSLLIGIILVYSFTFPHKVSDFQFISLEFQSKTIENKKYITTEGEVYFKKDNNLMVTHIKKPFESITIVNADGDMKIYDVENNTLILSFNVLNSSKYSYLWYFFTNNFQDMGLSKYGYIIKNTKIEDGVFVIEWIPPFNNNSSLYKIILAKENNLPIYQEFQDKKGNVLGKIFYSHFIKIGTINFPSKIVEISFKSKKDSVIQIKNYFSPKTDKQVNMFYLNFKIPSNAQIIHTK